MNFWEKCRTFGFILLIFGILTFSMRTFYFSCDSQKNKCEVFQILGIKQMISYPDIEDCTCGTYTETYTPDSEYKKQRIYRKFGHYGYQKKTRSLQRKYLNLTFNPHKAYKYKKLNTSKIQGYSCDEIYNVCTNIKNKQTFTFKSNQFVHDLFSFWYVFLLTGVLMLLLSRKLQ